ncbi:hypothetical protein ACFQL9_13040 [Halobaculum lipolyticum]|uniref:Yip1 domain-containing protein n=1 Tax=Halobaculum lipolyticum TaxID=3032001 RepID=A0ABD5WF92_9EURY
MSSGPKYDQRGGGDATDTGPLASSQETDTSGFTDPLSDMTGDDGPLPSLGESRRDTLLAFASAPAAFVLTIVIREAILRPTAAGIGLIDWVFTKVESLYRGLGPLLVGTESNPGPLWTAGEAYFIIPSSINEALTGSLGQYGLGAPLVYALTITIQAALVFVTMFAVVAIVISLIPGASGVTKTAGELWNRLT